MGIEPYATASSHMPSISHQVASIAAWRGYSVWYYVSVAMCVFLSGLVLGYALSSAVMSKPMASTCPPTLNIPLFQIEPLPTSTWPTPSTPDNPVIQGKNNV